MNNWKLMPEENLIGNISNKQQTGSEGELWKSFKGGNESAFIFIYEKYFGALYTFGSRFTKNNALLKDAIQDLFISLRNNRANLGDTDSIKFYLFKSLKRKIIKEENKWFNHFEPLNMDFYFNFTFSHEQVLIDQQINQEMADRLNEAIKSLSPRKREVIYYFYFEGLTYPQIQEIMGLDNVKSARNLIYKALDFLRTAMV